MDLCSLIYEIRHNVLWVTAFKPDFSRIFNKSLRERRERAIEEDLRVRYEGYCEGEDGANHTTNS